MSNLLLQISKDMSTAQSIIEEFHEVADEAVWTAGVSFDPGDASEYVLLAGLDHDNTDEGRVEASLKLYLALWTLRFATEKLMQSLAKEAFLHEETLKALIPDDMEIMDLGGTAPWDVPEI